METPLIFLTHNSEEPIIEFTPEKTYSNRPVVFYWYHDRFFDWSQNEYLHIILCRPNEYALRSRSGNLGFNGIHQDFKNFYQYWKEGDVEPAIVVSPSSIKTTLIGKIDHSIRNKKTEVVYPNQFRSINFPLLDENDQPKKFNEITELVSVLPEITRALPFIEPSKKGEEYHLNGFKEFATEMNGVFI